MTQSLDCRRSVIAVLQLLSSPDRQLAYERNVPQVRVTSELLGMWFDDTYLPEVKTFRQFFSDSELQALAAFDKFYDEQSMHLPDPRNGVADWLSDETWQQIMRRASELLNMLVR